MRCWANNVVPNFVTANAVIAAAYARVVLAYLRDFFAAPGADRSQPVYVLDVGAGHGKFAFLLLRELMEAHESWPDLGDEDAGAEAGAGAGAGVDAGAGAGAH